MKNLYIQVQRFPGANDRGIDIAGFANEQKLQGVWDNYQCKRYLKHAISPTQAWPEIGKILWHSFNKEYRAPRRYYFVAPHGVGTTLANLLANPAKLKKALIENWDKHVRKAITQTQEVVLEGDFLAYVQAFDFSIFDSKTALQVIEGHRQCPFHSLRFGEGLPGRPPAQKPPPQIAPAESRYTAQLLAAYAEHKKQQVPDVKALKHGQTCTATSDANVRHFITLSLCVFSRVTTRRFCVTAIFGDFVSDLPNSTNFARSLAGIRRAEPGQRSVESPGVRESPTARPTAPQLPCSPASGARNRK